MPATAIQTADTLGIVLVVTVIHPMVGMQADDAAIALDHHGHLASTILRHV